MKPIEVLRTDNEAIKRPKSELKRIGGLIQF